MSYTKKIRHQENKGSAIFLDFIFFYVALGGGSLIYINAPFEGALQWGTLTLDIVPQGHGGR